MTTTVESIIDALVTLEKALAGVAAAHDETPESLNALPAFVNYPGPTESSWGSFGAIQRTYTVVAELHVARGELKRAEAVCRPYINKFEAAVYADPTLGGVVLHVPSIRTRYGQSEWAGQQFLTVRFEVDCETIDDPTAE